MQFYRLRFERWRRGLGQRGGRFAPVFRDFEAPNRKAALKEVRRLWDEIRSDSVSVRYVELIEIVDWAPAKDRNKTMIAKADPANIESRS